MSLEVIQFLGAREDPGRKAFFDDNRTPAILCFVHLQVTLALVFQEKTSRGQKSNFNKLTSRKSAA